MLSLFVAVMLMACLVPVGSLAGTTKKGPDMGQALQGLLDQQVEEQGVAISLIFGSTHFIALANSLAALA